MMKKVLKIMVAVLLISAMLAVGCFAADETAAPVAGTDFGFAPVMAIVVICYLLAAGLKATPLDNKWLPVICGVCGGVLGALGMLIMPEYPAKDWMTAVAVGIVSGLAAVGVNQIGKQLGKTE